MIGIFDSGIGGLTAVRALLERAPDCDFVYLGDTARTPYGNKSKPVIERYAKEDAEYLLAHGAELILIACNTVSAWAMPALQEAFPTVQFIGVVDPAIHRTMQVAKKRVGVIGTRATIASGLYEKTLTAVRPELTVLSHACPLFVPLVEEGMHQDQVTKIMIRKYLMPLRQENIDTLILGCTHYPFLEPLIQRFMGARVSCVDTAACLIDQAMKKAPGLFEAHPEPVQRLVFTDLAPHTRQMVRQWIPKRIKMETAE